MVTEAVLFRMRVEEVVTQYPETRAILKNFDIRPHRHGRRTLEEMLERKKLEREMLSDILLFAIEMTEGCPDGNKG
jgi:iron-sulfur cluster repair protein YtfE (RIC family)